MDKKIANAKQKHILWVDLEMTGLEPAEDRILEVGAIVTDWNLQEIASLELPVRVDPEFIKQRMTFGPAKDFWESVPQTRDALIEQNNQAEQSTADVETALLTFIGKHFEKGAPIILAGNSIHMDRRFIEKEWPELNKLLHYRMLDVSAWKVVFENSFKTKFAKREAHRALDDIRGSIEELAYYFKKLKKNP